MHKQGTHASTDLSLSTSLSLYLPLSLQLVKLYMLHMARGHYSDDISEFLIISPVWQIAENSDESDFENFRSSLAVPKDLSPWLSAPTRGTCVSPPVHVRSVPCHSTQTKPEPKPKLTWLRLCHAEPARRLEIEFVCYSTCQQPVCLPVCQAVSLLDRFNLCLRHELATNLQL